jgi:hypothetical protein
MLSHPYCISNKLHSLTIGRLTNQELALMSCDHEVELYCHRYSFGLLDRLQASQV